MRIERLRTVDYEIIDKDIFVCCENKNKIQQINKLCRLKRSLIASAKIIGLVQSVQPEQTIFLLIHYQTAKP